MPNIRIKPELYQKLKEYKDKTGVPIAVALEKAAIQYLKPLEKKAGK